LKKLLALFIISSFAIFSINEVSGQINPDRQWTSYRGRLSSGVLDNANLPESFDFNKMTNVRWRTEIPGLGLSSPVVWDNKIFITSAITQSDKNALKTGNYGDITPFKDSSICEWKVYCLDKNSGKLIWEKTSYQGIPKMKRHPGPALANASVATDGKYVIAFFGSEGLFCYDMNGNLLWQKNFGLLKSVRFMLRSADWEYVSSPVIYNGILIIQCDVLENSFVATYEVKTGKELWKTQRDDYPGWCTPAIYKNAGKDYIALNGYMNRTGYDLESGKVVWKMSGGGDIQITTPVVGNNLIYFNSAKGSSSPIIAVKTNAVGDITLKDTETSNEYVKWSVARGGSYMHTLLLYRNHLYNVNWNGYLICLDPFTGKEIYTAKLGNTKSFIASPVASDGKLYIVDEEGTIYIIQEGDNFKLLAEIPMNDKCVTSPAITEGMIIFRTQKYLTGVGKNNKFQ
jgi:outer membrane protein assembly factor BamB